MLRNILVFVFLILLTSCNNEKIGVDIKDSNNDTSNISNDINNYTYTSDLVIDKESDQEKVSKYIKNNFTKINPSGNNYDELLGINFEGINNVNIEFIENNNRYKLILEYKVDNFSSAIELTRLGYYVYEDKIWKRLTSIPIKQNNLDNVQNDKQQDKYNNIINTGKNIVNTNTDISSVNTSSLIVDNKKRIQDMIIGTGADKIYNIKGFDNLNISKLSLNIAYPKYWYWRWINSNDAIATIIFSKEQVENIEDATIILKIKKNNTDATLTTSDMIILTKERDDKTIYELIGPINIQNTLQTMIDSATKIDNQQINTGSTN